MPDHSGDLLSALLDGELTAAEAETVRAHVASCGDCTRELDDVREARRLLRELPAVEPPSTFLDDLLAAGAADDVVVPVAPRRRRRGARFAALAAASVAAAAAIAVVVVQPTSTDSLDDDLEVALEQHESTVGALEDEGLIDHGASRLTAERPAPPTTARIQPLDEVDDDFEMPSRLGDYELIEAYDVGDGVHVVYGRGAYALSVFMRKGEIDFDALPDGGTRIDVGAHRAWRWDDIADGRLVVIDGEGVVITIAGDEPGDAVLDVARSLMKG